MTSDRLGPGLLSAAAFFDAVPAPRASTMVLLSTAKFMAVPATCTVIVAALIAVTVPRAFLVS